MGVEISENKTALWRLCYRIFHPTYTKCVKFTITPDIYICIYTSFELNGKAVLEIYQFVFKSVLKKSIIEFKIRKKKKN